MKAVVFDKPWEMSVQDIPEPRPAPHEVLLRTEAVGICGSDVHGFTGESGRRKPGMVMGHEVVARIVESGPHASRFDVGERVAVFNIDGCGTCPHCQAGQEQLCAQKEVLGVNAGTRGAMAEYFTWPETCLFPLPEDLDPAVGLLTEPIAVGIHAANLLQPRGGDPIAIVGAGTIGLGLATALRARESFELFVLDKLVEKLELARTFGATAVPVDDVDPIQTVLEATGGLGARGVFEAVGSAVTVRTAYDLCARGGAVVLIGNLAQEFTLPLQGVTSNETTIRGSYGFTKQDFAHAVALVSQRLFPLERLISGACTLDETPAVMRRMAAGELSVIKMVIRI